MPDSESTVNGRTFLSTHAHLLNYGLMFLLLAAVCIYSSFWGELVPAGNGLGWDGVRYGRWTKDFHVSEIGPYYLQRLFPIALIHYALVLFQAPLVDSTVIAAFRVANLLLILLACLVWILIANHLEISMKGKWLGFAGLFVNFAILKQAFYYPVLTDIPAFVLGLLAVYFFLKNNKWALFLVTLAAAFTWPMIVCTGVLFLLFPRKPVEAEDTNRSLPGVAVAVLVTAIYFGFAVYFYFVQKLTTLGYGEEKVLDSVAYLSLALSMLLLFGATLVLTRKISFRSLSRELRRFTALRIVMAGLIIVIEIIFALTPSARVGEPSGETHVATMHMLLLAGIALLSIAKPLITFVSHVVYFGPIIILLVLKWKTFSEEVRGYGIGLVSVILLSVFVGMDPESRHSIGAFPVFVPFLVKAVDRRAWRNYVYWIFGGVALVFSKVWFDINSASRSATPLGIGLQSYFMNHGCYMTLYSYVLQGSVILVALLFFYYLLRRQPSTGASSLAN
jgi:hypothetical protein